jgi:hypothetical protein
MVWWMRGKRKKERERAVVFLRNYPFFNYGNDNINQSCSIVVKNCCMNIISVFQIVQLSPRMHYNIGN